MTKIFSPEKWRILLPLAISVTVIFFEIYYLKILTPKIAPKLTKMSEIS